MLTFIKASESMLIRVTRQKETVLYYCKILIKFYNSTHGDEASCRILEQKDCLIQTSLSKELRINYIFAKSCFIVVLCYIALYYFPLLLPIS